MYERADYAIRVVGPHDLSRTSPEVALTECPEDITDSWYIIAREVDEALISVDCHADRLGRCYDSFRDCHGIVGSCAVVALSFTEVLAKLVEGRGGYWYWLLPGGAHGDAYDP